MSEHPISTRPRRRFRVRVRLDSGMTLPEVLVSVVITGTLMAAIAMAATLIIRQTSNTQGRLNNSQSEQSMGLWVPADLASAETVSTDPGAKPCVGNCPPGLNVGGSNALMLTWTGTVVVTTSGSPVVTPTVTNVSYRYVQNGTEFEMIRVACVSVGGAAPTCTQVTVLHELPAPPPGQEWVPGVTAPTWVVVVNAATDPGSADPNATIPNDPTYQPKNAHKVTVTINGGGNAAGAGGGQDVVTYSAGGTERVDNLSTNVLSDVPTFSATRSRCGGNFGMIVDTSGSIGSTNMTSVKNGITAFINSFAGTPIKLQIVRFSTSASTLGAGSGWSRYYDMLNESDVADLKTQVGTLSSTGATNYEDALFRMFENSNGTVQSILPDTLIFFTDGIPNYTRMQSTTGTAAATANPDDTGLPTPDGNNYSQIAWNRANRIARQFDADVDRFIGVFVGSDTSGTSTWITQGAGYHLTNFLRGYHTDYQYATTNINYQYNSNNSYQYNSSNSYQYNSSNSYQYNSSNTYQYNSSNTYQYNSSNTYQYNSSNTYQYATTGVVYEKTTNGGTTWSSVNWNTYAGSNTNPGTSDNYRIRVTGTPGGWTTIATVSGKQPKTIYDASNSSAGGTLDGVQVVGSTSGTWTTVSSVPTGSQATSVKDYFDMNNTDAANSDGFQVVGSTSGTWTNITSVPTSAATVATTVKDYYDLNNVKSGNSDGFNLVGSTAGTWTTITVPGVSSATTVKEYYDMNNSKSGNTDGINLVGSTAGTWTTISSVPTMSAAISTKDYYDQSNTKGGTSDGMQVVGSTSGAWTTVSSVPASSSATSTKDYFDMNNSDAANTDGFQTVGSTSGTWTTVSSVPASSPATSVKDYYDMNNNVAGNSDGFQVVGSTTGTWTTISSAPASSAATTVKIYYDQNNTAAANTDGFQITASGTPGGWTSLSSVPSGTDAATVAAYYAENDRVTTDGTDGFQQAKLYSSPYNSWDVTDSATYTANNTSWGASDGWDATKDYTVPYDFHEAYTTSTKTNTSILANLVTVGTPVNALPTGGPYTNAAVADMYILPNWDQFAGALNGVALAECGGTLTLQTRIGGAAAADPFTYQNSVDLKIATTSSQYHSGTFDYDLSSGKAITTTITPMNLSDLNKYKPVSWSCTASGSPYSFTTVPIAGTDWTAIRLSVSPNTAVSCIQTVALR